MVLVKFHDMTVKESFSQPLVVKLWNAYRKVRGHKFSHVSVLYWNGMEIYFPLLGDEPESMPAEDVDKMVANSETWDIPTTNFWNRLYKDYFQAPPSITTCSNWVWYGLTGQTRVLITPDEVYKWVSSKGTKAARAVVQKTI